MRGRGDRQVTSTQSCVPAVASKGKPSGWLSMDSEKQGSGLPTRAALLTQLGLRSVTSEDS